MPETYSKTDAYISYFVAGMKNSLAYKADLFLSLVFRIASSLVMVLVWTAVYLHSGIQEIGGFTLPFMYGYFFLYKSINLIINSDISETMQNDIQSGSISTSLIRPTKYLGQVLFTSLGSNFVWGLFSALPVILLISLFVPLNLGIGTALLLAAEMVLGLAAMLLVDFFVGTLAIYLTNVYGLMNVVNTFILALSGGIVPLNILPNWMQSIVFLTPFQMMGYMEAGTLLNVVSIDAIMNGAMVTLVWIALLAIAGYFWWKRASLKITAVRG